MHRRRPATDDDVGVDDDAALILPDIDDLHLTNNYSSDMSDPPTPQHYGPGMSPIVRSRRHSSKSTMSTIINDDGSCDEPLGDLARAKRKVLLRKHARLTQYLSWTTEDLRKHVCELRTFARTEGGLVTDEIRAKVWPILADCIDVDLGGSDAASVDNDSNCSCSESDYETARSSVSISDDDLDEPSISSLKTHPEWHQVEMDVNRTLTRFPPGTDEDERVSIQRDLIPLIVRILSENDSFRYYQGFHDICLTLILVLGVAPALKVTRILANRFVFRGYLTRTLEATAMHDLGYMYVLLHNHNRKLEEHLREAELGCLFALSWPLTWFSHVIDDYPTVVNCFDVFLSTPHLFPIYVTAAVVLAREEEIYNTEKDMAMLHHLLSRFPSSLDMSEVLSSAFDLLHRYPPDRLTGALTENYRQACVESQRQYIRPPPPGHVLSRYAIGTWIVAGTVSAAAVYYMLWSSNLLLQNSFS